MWSNSKQMGERTGYLSDANVRARCPDKFRPSLGKSYGLFRLSDGSPAQTPGKVMFYLKEQAKKNGMSYDDMSALYRQNSERIGNEQVIPVPAMSTGRSQAVQNIVQPTMGFISTGLNLRATELINEIDNDRLSMVPMSSSSIPDLREDPLSMERSDERSEVPMSSSSIPDLREDPLSMEPLRTSALPPRQVIPQDRLAEIAKRVRKRQKETRKREDTERDKRARDRDERARVAIQRARDPLSMEPMMSASIPQLLRGAGASTSKSRGSRNYPLEVAMGDMTY